MVDSNKKIIRVLLVDYEEDDHTITHSILQDCYDKSLSLTWSNTYDDALTHLLTNKFQVCLMSYNLGSRTGVDLLHELATYKVDTPVIMLTDEQDRNKDIAAMQAGASDYLIKTTITTELVERSIRYAIDRKESEMVRRNLEQKVATHEKIMSVGCLAIGMAHEINNPLGGVVQSVQNLERRLDPSREKNLLLAETCGINLENVNSYMIRNGITDFIERIKVSGDRISKIISTILQFSGHAKSQRHEVNIIDLIKETVLISTEKLALTEEFGINHLKIDFDFDRELTSINCINHEIKNVLTNIIENSLFAMTEERCSVVFTPESLSEISPQDKDLEQLKYMPVNTSNLSLKICTKKDENTAVITIEDNGPGMSDEVARRIFEPFFTTTRTGKTGLGLAIAYYIITSTHNGSIEVQSKEGVGTKLIIRLPIGC